MKVMLAQSAGFCFGVRRAVQLAEKIAALCGGSLSFFDACSAR